MKSNRVATLFIGFTSILFSLYILVALLTRAGASETIMQFWPVVLIFLGVLTISPNNPGSNGISLGLIGFGIFGGLYRVGTFQTPQGQAILAVLLGFIGLVILIMLVSKPRNKNNFSPNQSINKSNRS